jgi:hypothetical protein
MSYQKNAAPLQSYVKKAFKVMPLAQTSQMNPNVPRSKTSEGFAKTTTPKIPNDVYEPLFWALHKEIM